MSNKSKLEFAVQMTCNSCVSAIKSALMNKGIDEDEVKIDLEKESVVVETDLSSEKVKAIIEETGRRAVIIGVGSVKTGKHLGAAVSMISGTCVGVLRMIQSDEATFIVDGTIDGLPPLEKFLIAVHECGDLSEGCESCGGIYGSDDNSEKPIGSIGEISAAESGRSTFRFENSDLKVWELIGRSIVISSVQSTLSVRRLACGIIARSAGLFQNSKRICACDGVPVWDERDVPIAGSSRSKTNRTKP